MAKTTENEPGVDPDQVNFPLKEFLDFEVEHGEGTASAWLTMADHHLNPNGVAHGSVAFTLMDTAMGAAVVSVLEQDQLCATVEIQTRYHRPASAGTLRAEAEIVSGGRRLMHLQARTTDDEGRLVASATSSFAIFAAP